MMKKLSYLSAAVALMMLSACGNKLTDEQKAKLKGLNGNMSQSLEAGKGAKAEPTETGLYFAKKDGTPSDDNVARMVARIQEEKSCKFDAPKPTGNLKTVGISYGVSGESCPVSFKFMTTGDEKSGMTFDVKYKVTDPEFAKLSDVTEINLSVTTKIKIAGKNVNVELKGAGTVTSAQYGKVDMKYNGAMEVNDGKVNMDVTVEIVFADFTAELGIHSPDGKEVKFTLNGEDISAEDFATYASGVQGGEGGLDLGKSPSASSSQSSSQPINMPSDPSDPMPPMDPFPPSDPTPPNF